MLSLTAFFFLFIETKLLSYKELLIIIRLEYTKNEQDYDRLNFSIQVNRPWIAR